MSDPYLAGVRREYLTAGVDVGDVDPNPVVQFGRWLETAVAEGLDEPNAMVLATVGPDGTPSARSVLLKGFDESGFVFYTSFESRKGHEIAANPAVALVFTWLALHRQVRIEGTAVRVTDAEADAYFATRPTGARVGSAASSQSAVIPDRAWLDARVAELAVHHPDGAVPRPGTWGGFRVVPGTVELWQGRPNRLHDRIRYRRAGDGWLRERLAP